MKRKILAPAIGLFAVALVGTNIYYASENHRIESEANARISQSQQSKLVPVDFTVAVPSNTPKDQLVYLSGSAPSLGNWDSAGVPLEKKDDGKWHTSVQVLSGIQYGYKVTRGTWGTVETDSKGAAIPDRALQLPDAGAVDVTVADWVDHGQAIPGRVTMTGDLRLLKNFRSKLLNNQRTVIVYLPPGYDRNTDQHYPVLYMQDGQNLFDEATSFAGVEWKMDEAAQKLIGSGEIKPFMIVGIYNSPDRTSEFTPNSLAADGKSTDGAVARGDLYGRFIVEELKPWIDQTYRTMPDRAHTLIGGGSLGGLISLDTARLHPDVFGQMIVLSPWLRSDDRKLLPAWIGDGKWLHTERIYADMGTTPGNNNTNYPGGAVNAVADGKEFATVLQSAGLQPDKDYTYKEIPGGKHDEPSFQSEIESVLQWTFAK